VTLLGAYVQRGCLCRPPNGTGASRVRDLRYRWLPADALAPLSPLSHRAECPSALKPLVAIGANMLFKSPLLRHVDAGAGAASMGFGAVISFGVGLGALWLLRGVVTRGRFFWFVLWVVPLAVVTLIKG
jgi:hypothetical protein